MKPVSPVLPAAPECMALKECVIGKDQPQYLPLPALVTSDGMITSRWKLSWLERWLVLWRGSIWVQSLTFSQPLQPIKLSVYEPEVSGIEKS